MAIVYAVAADLTAWAGVSAPTNADQLLRSASRLVRDATLTAYFDVDSNGVPTDAALKTAFNEATCAQAALWAAAGIDPAGGGLTAPTAPAMRKKLDSAEIFYDTKAVTSDGLQAARQASTETLCDESLQILQEAGMNLTTPWIVG